ncbi:MAG: leucine-rich repeat protein [Bacteroides sp.]|nr:leucine-rich repeat protein [Bacteroides sp.]MDD3041152.1 leucine-rich repeat protein [Bacteroides sp.]
MGDYAFRGCTGLTSIDIPQSVTNIGMGAFSTCTGLTSITFNSATTTIYDYERTIPATTKIIGYDPSTAKDYATKYNITFEVINLATNDIYRGLVAYYEFEGNANDSSGNANDGNIQGKVTFENGVIKKAIKFGGVYNPGVVRVPTSDSLKFSDALCISFFTKIDDTTGVTGYGAVEKYGFHTVIAKSHDTSGTAIWSVFYDDCLSIVYFSDWYSYPQFSISGSAKVNPKNWNHVVLAITNNSAKI